MNPQRDLREVGSRPTSWTTMGSPHQPGRDHVTPIWTTPLGSGHASQPAQITMALVREGPVGTRKAEQGSEEARSWLLAKTRDPGSPASFLTLRHRLAAQNPKMSAQIAQALARAGHALED